MEKQLEEIRTEVVRLGESRLSEADLGALSRYKLPGKTLMVLQGLLWRAEELSRNAVDALSRQDFVTSAVLTRALMETLGGIVLIHTLVSEATESGVKEGFDGKINRLLLGSKQWEEMEDPVHVNDLLREVQKVIPGFFDEHYASLSEYAHPNWLGTFGAYGATHEGEARVTFSSEGRDPDRLMGTILGRLSGTVGMCIGYREMIEHKMEGFVEAVEAFYANKT